MRVSRWVFLGLLLALVVQALLYYPQLPERMASHFNAGGHPNGWQSRTGYFSVQAFVVAVVTAAFAVLPAWIQRLPARLINLPNKDYWLAPERRAETMARVSAALTWFGCAVLTFILLVTRLVVRFNLGLEPELQASALSLALGALVVCVVALVLRLLYLGRRPPT